MDTQVTSAVAFDQNMYLTDHTEAERKAWNRARLVDERDIQIDGDLPGGYALRSPTTAQLAVWADGTHSLSGPFGMRGTSAHGLDAATALYRRFLVYRLRYLTPHNCTDHWCRGRFRRVSHPRADFWVQAENGEFMEWCQACRELDYLQSIVTRKDEQNT